MFSNLVNYAQGRLTGHLKSLPVLVLMPHSRCNCRCVMCDIWLANKTGREITVEDIRSHLDDFRKLGVRHVVLSGGEPLMHSNLWSFCEELKSLGVRLTLLSTGLLLKAHSQQVTSFCDDVIVSLDGSRDVHNAIRRIPDAYEKLAEGVNALRSIVAGMQITARCVLQRSNYHDLFNIVEAARALGLNQISFLAADVTSTAFNRPVVWSKERVDDIALNEADTKRFAALIEDLIRDCRSDIQCGFIAESEAKLRRLPAYYAAVRGSGDYPTNHCNAPWVSAVVEADGEVRPCFFHKSLGNIHRESFSAILNGSDAVSFRRGLDVSGDPICRKCVCTLNLNPRSEM